MNRVNLWEGQSSQLYPSEEHRRAKSKLPVTYMLNLIKGEQWHRLIEDPDLIRTFE